jgi:carbon storage regulator
MMSARTERWNKSAQRSISNHKEEIMLVLSRKPGETILVPECGVAVTVVAINGNRVRLGISAPENVDIYREEIWLEIRPESHRSAPPKG